MRKTPWKAPRTTSPAGWTQTRTQSKQVGRSDGLLALGLSRYMADALGAGSCVTVKIAFGKTSLGHLTKVLRVLIPLVCPNITQCPAEVEVAKTLATPALADMLKDVAGSARS